MVNKISGISLDLLRLYFTPYKPILYGVRRWRRSVPIPHDRRRRERRAWVRQRQAGT